LRSRRRAIFGNLGGRGVGHYAGMELVSFGWGERCVDELFFEPGFALKLVRLKEERNCAGKNIYCQ
jgi:hypothetical protein